MFIVKVISIHFYTFKIFISMKKNLLFLSIVILSASCQKDPDSSKLDNDFIVKTDYDAKANFSSYSSYYIPDSVLIIGEEKEPRYMVLDDTDDIISTFVTNMDSRGYTRINDKSTADLGIQVSYIENDSYFYGYHDYPYWWWGYPGYWGPGYWGDWGGWYYPYPVVYSYQTGSLLAEIVDLKAKTPKATNSLSVLWTAYMTGLISGSNNIDTQLSIRAVNQAFTQSSYIKK